MYAYLIFCEDRETHQCWPSIGKICQHTGMNANTVAKYIRQLEEKRLIDTEPTKVQTRKGIVRNGNLLYTIRPIQGAVERKFEQEFSALPKPKPSRKKRGNPNSAPCAPVCGFEGEVEETTPARPQTRPVGPAWAGCEQQ